ncbi:carotenoid biosynthesis protein [Pseudoclavibacter sp. RFBB5]|uniref:carotenoid biosynthesis protein n=1 Tax=Pseudoclavibacter sp. RFBB5 TaxID=2080574 RepID=UPI001C681574|nr:carotenoid biosynthesis protein [Pseudoclavibacter sp. RFBB5]
MNAITRRLMWVTLAAGMFVQSLFAFTGGGTIPLTIASVALLAATGVLHAWATRGPKFASVLLAAAAIGFFAEVVGVATSFPFGQYIYTPSLGFSLFEVPLIVPLAWVTIAYPAVIIARRLVGTAPGVLRRIARVAVAAWALTAWDVFLDPQMVDSGHWGWKHPDPGIPGVDGIPLTNFLGWYLVSLIICGLIDAVAARSKRIEGAPGDAVPFTVYLWTYATCVVGNLTFFERPSVALVGGIIMGAIAVPLVVVLLRDWRARRSADDLVTTGGRSGDAPR